MAQASDLLTSPWTRCAAGRNRINVVHRELAIIQPDVFQRIFQAIRTARGVKIAYSSMRNPEPHLRVVFPHALVQAGGRWHMRAYVAGVEPGFRDFNIGRIASAEPADELAPVGQVDDEAWMTTVSVLLVPHPELTSKQQAVVRREYAGDSDSRVINTRGALLTYLLQEQRIAVDPARDRPPEYQLALANAEELRRWIFT